MLRKSFITLALAASLGGCAGVLQDISLIRGASVPAPAVGIAISAWTGVESIGVAYESYCARTATPPPGYAAVCTKTLINQVATDVRIGHKEAVTLGNLLRANANASIPVASYNTFKAEIDTLQGVITQYNLATPGAPVPASPPPASVVAVAPSSS